MSARAESGLRASNLARSAISAGVAKVLEDENFGVAQDPAESVFIQTEHGTAFLSFNAGQANQNGVLGSTNNAGGNTSVNGDGGRVVPASSIHLIAKGFSGGVERQVEAVLSVPSFPWALAAGGDIIIRDGAIVGSLPEGVWPPTQADLLPADLVSNSTSDSSVVLGSGSRVLGDIDSAGRVLLQDASVQVDGTISESAGATTLPTMNPQDFDPAALGLAYDDLETVQAALATTANTNTGALNLSGATRHTGALTLSQDVQLTGAVLYIEGDLSVNGSVNGSGVLVVDGDVNISSGVTLDGATKVAIVSSGRVNLRGVGPASSSIRGLFYAEQGLHAEEITVVGSMIAGGPSAGVELVNSRALGQSISANTQAGTTLQANHRPGQGGDGSNLLNLAQTFDAFLDGTEGGTGTSTTSGPPTATPTNTGGDSSSFLPLKERMRVVSWFES